MGRFPMYLPMHGKTSHVWEDFLCMGSLPIDGKSMGSLPMYGKTSQILEEEDFPYMGRLPKYEKASQIWEDLPYMGSLPYVWEAFPHIGRLGLNPVQGDTLGIMKWSARCIPQYMGCIHMYWGTPIYADASPYTGVPQYMGMHPIYRGNPSIWGCIPVYWGRPQCGGCLRETCEFSVGSKKFTKH
jgi:hypothetical protein